MTEDQEIRLAALTLATKHLNSHNASYQGASTVIAFAREFEKFVKEGAAQR